MKFYPRKSENFSIRKNKKKYEKKTIFWKKNFILLKRIFNKIKGRKNVVLLYPSVELILRKQGIILKFLDSGIRL